MRKHITTVVKFTVFVVLIWWVFSNIQLIDQYTKTLANGTAQKIEGRIIGPWDQPSFRFQEAGSTEVEVIDKATDLNLQPGLMTYWRNLDVPWFLVGALCYLLSVAFAATRWWWLLKVNDLPISYWAAFRFTWIGIFFNNVVPGQTGGDLIKAIYVMKRCHDGRVPALMSVIIDRLMGLASLSLLAAFAVLFYLDSPDFASLAVALWAVLAGVILMGVVAFSRRVRTLIRLKRMLDMLPETLGNILKRVDHAVFFYRQHKVGMGYWLLGGIVNHVFSVVSIGCVGMALGIGVPMSDYFVLIPVIVTISAIPIAPNGWGVGESLYAVLFGKFCAVHLPAQGEAAPLIMATRGVALSICYRIHLTAWSLVGGVMYFLDKDKVTRQELADEVKREEVAEAVIDAEIAAAENPPETAESGESLR